MCSSPSSFFFSLIIILRLGILLLFVLLEKKSSKNFIPFLHLDQFRVFVFLSSPLLGTDQHREEDKDKEDKDGALLLVDEFNDDNNIERSLRDLRLFACGLKRSLLPRKVSSL